MFDYSEHEDWKAYSTKIQANWKLIREYESKQSILLYKITSLGLAHDLMNRKQGELYEVSKKTTKILKNVTGDCDECWFGAYGTCDEEIQQLRISKCLEVSSYSTKIDQLKEINTRLDSEQDYLRDRLVEEHKAQKDIKPTADAVAA